MPVRITCRDEKISQELHDLVEKKVSRLKKFFVKVDKIEVIFSSEKHRRKCEINVHAAPFDCTAIMENGEEGSAFDKALHAIEAQIHHHKTKMYDRRKEAVNPEKATRRNGRHAPVAPVE